MFIGSATESLAVAYAIQENLEYFAEVTVWTQGVFAPSQTTLQSLLAVLESFDFAVFVFTPDDVVKLRDQTFRVARDNVIYELGLFTGRLGRDRAFIALPRDFEDLHLPTDLAGITPVTYDPNRTDGNLTAAVGVACSQLQRTMSGLGPRESREAGSPTVAAPAAAGLADELREEMSRMARQQEQRIAEAIQLFDQRLEHLFEVQNTGPRETYLEAVRTVEQRLTSQARALLKAVNRSHLTFDQYKALQGSALAEAVKELRFHDLLIPLSGYSLEGRDIPVYWFPPTVSQLIVAASEAFEAPDEQTNRLVSSVLSAIGYPGS